MRKLFVLLTVMTAGLQLWAEDYTYLTVEKSDGTTTTMTANGLTITFADGQFHATNGTESWTLPLNSLSKMYFSNTDAISQSLSEAEEDEVTVYSTSGIAIGKFNSIEEAKSQLNKGVYVIRSSSRTIKISIK